MTADPFLPFALPDVGDEEIEAVGEAIRSGWLSSGPQVQAFESAFAETIGDGIHAIAVNSATAGLHLAVEALGLGPGDEVLVPTWTFTATAEVVRYVGAKPVFVDADRETLNIDLAAAEAAVTPRTRAVLPVHFAGLPVDPTALRSFAHAHDLRVVEDAAHAFPACRSGLKVGAGDSEATVFSFYATKTMTTGEGGMLLTRQDELARRARVMRLHGISRDAFDRYRSNVPSWRYDVIAPGFKYNMTDMAASIGLVQLRRSEDMRRRRERIAHRYLEDLNALPLDLPSEGGADDVHAWHLFVVRVREQAGRDRLVQRLSSAGVGTSVHFIPLHMQPYWRDTYGLCDSQYPVASQEFERVISLPLYSAMTDDDVSRVIAAVRGAVL